MCEKGFKPFRLKLRASSVRGNSAMELPESLCGYYHKSIIYQRENGIGQRYLGYQVPPPTPVILQPLLKCGISSEILETRFFTKQWKTPKTTEIPKWKNVTCQFSLMNGDGLGIWNTVIKDQLLVCEGKIKFYKGLPTPPGEIHRKFLSQR